MFANVSKKVVAVAMVAAMAVTTAAVTDTSTAEAAGVKLNKKKVTVMQGKSVKLTANGKATWKSSKTTVAVVTSASGKSTKVKGIKAGSAKVTATVGSKKATCSVKVTKAKSGTMIYNLAKETGSNPDTGESWAPPVKCTYADWKYDSFSIWLCRAVLYDPANGGVDYRGIKLKISITIKNTGKRNLPELGVCFNNTKGGKTGSYPWALHVSEKKLAAKVSKAANHSTTKIIKQKIKKGKTYTWTFNHTIPKDAMNGDKDQETGINYPIMMYIPNLKDSCPYVEGDALTVQKCTIKVA